MLTNTNITIFHALKSNKQTKYIATQLFNVSCRGLNQNVYNDKNVTAEERFVIRIPYPTKSYREYIDKNTYNSLGDCEKEKYFTVAKGDYIVQGLVDDEITAPSELIKKYDEVLKVVSVTDNIWLSAYTAHIKVIAK